jgi:protein phosphatase
VVRLEYSGRTDVGKTRANNEDALLVGADTDDKLFAIADGMGSHKAGEVASFLTVAALKKLGPGDCLKEAIRRADRTILACRGEEEFADMGTTVVALRFREEDGYGLAAEVAHIGDSRAYLLRAGRLRRLTEDHSLVAELVQKGGIPSARASDYPCKNVLTQALGAGDVAVEGTTFHAWPGDRVVLCSDGLSDAVAEEEIVRVLEAFPGDPEGAVQGLVGVALEAGGGDNVTVVVVDLKNQVSASPSLEGVDSGARRWVPKTLRRLVKVRLS